MAGGSEFDPSDTFENSPIFNGMEAPIAQILRKCCSASPTDIIEELFDTIDEEEVKKTRDVLYV